MTDKKSGWREPAKQLPLRWGSYRARYAAALLLLFVGAILVQFTSTYSLFILPLGLVSHITGWCIMPGIGWRRVLGAVVSTFNIVLLLNGAPATLFLIAPLAVWLLLRQRPLVSYLTLVLPAATALLLTQFFPDYGWSVIVITVAGLALIGAAWLARSLAAMSGRSSVISG